MPRKSQEESQETRKNILECAKRLFSRRGYERTSLSDIAKYSGVSRGAIYWHFESKEDLLINLVEYNELNKSCIRYFAESCDPNEQDPLEKLKSSLLALFSEETVEDFSSGFVTMLVGIGNGFVGTDDAKKKLDELNSQRMDQLQKVLANCVRRKKLPENLDVRAAAEHLAMFMTGFFFQARIRNTETLRKYSSKLVDMEFEQIQQLLKS